MFFRIHSDLHQPLSNGDEAVEENQMHRLTLPPAINGSSIKYNVGILDLLFIASVKVFYHKTYIKIVYMNHYMRKSGVFERRFRLSCLCYKIIITVLNLNFFSCDFVVVVTTIYTTGYCGAS